MECKYCHGKCTKYGRQKNGNQRYHCKNCGRKQQADYRYRACRPEIDRQIIALTKECVGIRGTARLLRISTTTLLRRILSIAAAIRPPELLPGRVYEVDEMRTFVRSKREPVWIVYALDRASRRVAGFQVGSRTNRTLDSVLEILRRARARRIYTDRLRQYATLIHRAIHRTLAYGTNRIERHNLTLRTHLSRLTRRTIRFSKTALPLAAVLTIYFRG